MGKEFDLINVLNSIRQEKSPADVYWYFDQLCKMQENRQITRHQLDEIYFSTIERLKFLENPNSDGTWKMSF